MQAHEDIDVLSEKSISSIVNEFDWMYVTQTIVYEYETNSSISIAIG